MLIAGSVAEPWSDRLLWAVLGAAVAFVIREAWDWRKQRAEKRRRTRAVLTALAREVFVIRAKSNAIVNDVNRERQQLPQGVWRLKPLLRLPTDLTSLLREDVPTRLLELDGFGQIAALQTQCEFTNQVAAAQYAWKSPDARNAPDQLKVIADFHPALEETLLAVVERCDRVIKILETAAVDAGGLELARVAPTVGPVTAS